MKTISNNKKDAALRALQGRHHALLICGNLFDLQVEPGSDVLYYRPLYLAEKLYEEGRIILRYSRSSGLSIHRQTDIKEHKKTLDDVLQRTGLNRFIGSREFSPTEVIEIFRGFKSIVTTRYSVPFTIMLDYGAHLTSSQSSDREMQIVAESISDMANLPSVQKAGNCLIVYAHDETNLSPLLKVLYKVHYSYPDISEYQTFFKILRNRSSEFAETLLAPEEAAKLAKGLTLSQLASIFREAKENNKVIGKPEIIAAKELLINQISDGTLKVLPTDISFEDMAGLEVTKKILLDFAEKLSRQDPASPRAILLAGPPGTGKTTIASALANACSFNLCELSDKIKSKWLGDSEARLFQALSTIESLAPVILFIDEIDQAFGNRTSTDLDGGVSSHYLKTLFKFAARDDLRGKIVILGCSNTPQLLDPALINRFVTIPLLEPTPVEMAAIFPKVERRITGRETLNPFNANLIKACEILYRKGASPRQIFDIINKTITKFSIDFKEHHILESCILFRSNGDPISGAYSSLSAIRLTAFDDFFPWAGNPKYPLPWYLEGIVNLEDGTVNDLELNRKMAEFKAQSKY